MRSALRSASFGLTCILLLGGADVFAQTSSPARRDAQTQEAPAAPVTVNPAPRGTLPVGQEFEVRLRNSLSSETAAVEQRFETTTIADLVQEGKVLVPAGTVVKGFVSEVRKAGRIDRSGSVTLSFDRLATVQREREIRATATSVFESRGIRDEIGTVGAGAGVGGVIGGLLGGVKGALLGVIIGAGGTIAATDGKDISVPAGSIIRIRLDSPVQVE